MNLPLKQLRKAKNITQLELSKALKISPSAVGMWEQGRNEPSYEMLKKIADYFNVTTDYLLGRDSKQSCLSKNQTNLLEIFNDLNDEGQSTLMVMLNSLKKSHAKNEEKMSSVVQNNKIKNNYGAVGNFSSNVTIV